MFTERNVKPSDIEMEMLNLRIAIADYLKVVGGKDIDNVIEVEDDPNEVFFRNEIYSVTYKIDEVFRDIKYLQKEVVAEGNLYLNGQDRYEIDSSHYLSSGSVCEILIDADSRWVKTSIEHDYERGYYAVALGREVALEGLRARVRR